MAKKSSSRSCGHGLNHTMKQCLIEHWGPTKMGTITKMTVDMLSLVIKKTWSWSQSYDETMFDRALGSNKDEYNHEDDR